MDRAPKIAAALAVWAASSAFLFFMCIFSINETIIMASIIIAAVSLIGSIVAFVMKRDRLAVGIAAIPAFVIAGLLVMFAVFGYTHYYK